ncbi:YcdB/YcdC domain-containing protein [uncultured Clostridium sp.]|uniref:YcdB/YcdC domain-containing protein n=1 Tax=uncultured Clostridium sp. TaxID=59620 RepID=UPI0028E8F9D1|nr:YcdB/YcdC domain-containing protein [uncultured Clostridium sp.]
MKNKKIISLVISSSIVITNLSSVSAMSLKKELNPITVPIETIGTNVSAEKDVKLSKEKAKDLSKKIIKDYFNKTVDEKEYQVYVALSNDGEDKNYSWDISWRKNSMSSNIYMDVSINANTGKVLRASNRYDVEGENSGISKITEEEGKKKAQEFLKRINPEQFKETKYTKESMYSIYGKGSINTSYSYRFARQINDIPYNDDGLVVEVDGVKGEVISYYSSWEEGVKLAVPGKYLSIKEAEDIFRKDSQVDLKYITYRDKYDIEEDSTRTKLVYMINLPYDAMLDANEGKFMNKDLYKSIEKDLTQAERKEINSKLKIKKPLDKEISEKRALEIAKSTIKELYGDGYEIGNIRYYENEDKIYGNFNAWSIDFNKKVEGNKGYDGGNITIDALTENIINLYKNYYKENEKLEANISWEEAYKIAIDSVAKYSPEKFNEINTKAITNQSSIDDLIKQEDKRYYFNFPRVVNGIPFHENGINVWIGANKGQLYEYSVNWNENMKFDSPVNLVQKEEGKNILFSKDKPQLSYRKINKSKDYTKPQWETKLIYTMGDSYRYNFAGLRVDAFTGKLLNASGEDIDENIDIYMEKIKGNPYEKELTILANNGIIDTTNFQAEKEITKMDFIKMLVNAKGYRPNLLKDSMNLKFESGVSSNDVNYKYLQLAVYYGILENKEGKFDIKEKVTRAEMAKTLVKFLGYDKLANSKDVFSLNVSDVKDIKSNELGYMAIAKGLGILEVKNNKLRPKSNVTWNELSIGIYRVLDNIKRGY